MIRRKSNLMKLVTHLLLLCIFTTLHAQKSKITTINLKKGEVFDLLLATRKPDTQEAIKEYFKKAVSVAKTKGYRGVYSNGIASYTLGNFQPKSIIFGQWPNLKNRLDFIDLIETAVPDFHERRRQIFSAFFLTFWEVQQDLNFSIHKDKYTIVTAFWKKDSKFDSFKKRWNQIIKSYKGQELVSFSNGMSPFGYSYNPDYLVITEFNNEADFNSFQKNTKNFEYSGVENVQQLVIK